jgi:20S proteasome alpha/beta subunit
LPELKLIESISKYHINFQINCIVIQPNQTFRNVDLAKKGFPLPKATKTGTTIVGIIYKDGVILGADTRATEDTTVSDKNCQKIHYLAPNM